MMMFGFLIKIDVLTYFTLQGRKLNIEPGGA